MAEHKGQEGDESKNSEFNKFLKDIGERLQCAGQRSWSRRIQSLGDTCILTVRVVNLGDNLDESVGEPCLRIMFYRPGTPHASLSKVDITAGRLRQHVR